ncbi:MAG: hypothetical protein GY725_16395 [bacterium]|nr:hypothetical protein [bacterium]
MSGTRNKSVALFSRAGIGSVWTGALIAALMLGIFATIAWIQGSLDMFLNGEAGLWEYREARIGILVAVLAGFLPGARQLLAEGAQRDFDALRGQIDLTPSAVERFCLLDTRSIQLAGCAGLAIVPLTALAIDRDPGLYLQSEYWNGEQIFSWLVGGWVTWNLGILIYSTLSFSNRFSELAAHLRRLDLFDLQALSPFSRHGLRSALVWLVLASTITLNAVDVAWFATTGVFALLLGASALMLPVRGIHERLREAKRAELERVDAAIRGNGDALSESAIRERASDVSLSDLLAYRDFIISVREWPFDAPAIRRFGLYLAIPLTSWLGGALVERLLFAALD